VILDVKRQVVNTFSISIITLMFSEIRINVSQNGILSGMDATSIASHIKAKDFTAQEALDCVRSRAEETEPIVNAIVASDYDLTGKTVASEGVFAGVPTFIKDLVQTKGFATRQGCEGVPNVVAKKHEKVMHHIASTGVVVAGKSTTSEFGLLPSSETHFARHYAKSCKHGIQHRRFFWRCSSFGCSWRCSFCTCHGWRWKHTNTSIVLRTCGSKTFAWKAHRFSLR
jgi:hypothetical protein